DIDGAASAQHDLGRLDHDIRPDEDVAAFQIQHRRIERGDVGLRERGAGEIVGRVAGVYFQIAIAGDVHAAVAAAGAALLDQRALEGQNRTVDGFRRLFEYKAQGCGIGRHLQAET